MEAWLQHLNHWDWGILAAVLILLEITAPAFFFLWLGLAAGITGLATWLMPELGWKAQVLTFSGLALVSVALWQVVLRKRPTPTTQPMLNRRGNQYIGRLFTLEEPVVNGMGKIRVDDTIWKVAGPELPVGSRVRVTAVEGAILRVEAAP